MLDQIIIHLSAALAAAYLLWTVVGSRRGGSCGSGCRSCGAKPQKRENATTVTLTIGGSERD